MDRDPLAEDVEVKVEVGAEVEMEEEESEESDEGSDQSEEEDDATTGSKVKYKMSAAKRAWSREAARRMREKLGREESNRRKNEQRKRRLQTMTPEELEGLKEKTRCWAQLRAERRTEEERERKRVQKYERMLKKRLEQGLPPPRNMESPRKGPLTEEEKQRRKEKYAFHELTKRLRLTEEEKEVRRTKGRFARYAKLARMSEEERKAESRRLVQKEKVRKANMTPEQKERYREQMTKAHRKMRHKWREQYPEKYERHKKYILERSKMQMEKETPEQKQKRLLGYRIYQKKTRLRKQLEKEGVAQEEIERRVLELVEEMKSQPLPPLPDKPRKYERKAKYNKKSTSVSILPDTDREVPSTSQYSRSDSDNIPQSFQNQNQFVRGLSQQFPRPSEDPSYPTWDNYSEGEVGNHNHSSISSVSSHGDPDLVGDADVNDNFDDIPASSPSPSSPAKPPQLEMEIEFTIPLPQQPATLSASTLVPPPPKRGRGRPPKNSAPLKLTVPIASKPTAVTNKTRRSRTSVPIVESPTTLPPPSPSYYDPGPKLDMRITSTCTLAPLAQASPTASTTTVAIPSEPPTVSSVSSITSSPSKPVDVITEEIIILPEMCEDCGKTFKSKLNLRIHKSDFHNEDPENLTCPKCSTQCETKQGLWEHFFEVHNMGKSNNEEGTSPVKVNQQGRILKPYHPKPKPRPSSQSSTSTNAQPKTRKDEQPSQCPECGKFFRQKATLDDHIRRTHEGKGHYCDVCGSGCQSLTKLWRHKVERHGMSDLPPPEGIQVISCKYCEELVMRGYEAHARKKHPEHLDEFLNSDDKNIKLKTVRVRHKTGKICRPNRSTVKSKSAPTPVVSEVKCPKCDETMSEKALKKHWRAKHSLPCPGCGKLCDDVPELEEHYRKMHAFKDIDKKLEAKNLIKFVHPLTKAAVCLICDANLPWSDEIHGHFVSKHHDVLEEFLKVNCSPSVPCELCEGLQFLTDVELSVHMESDHPDENYLCPHCGLFRRTQAELDYHVKSHGFSYRLNRKKFGCCFICKEEFLEVNGVKDIFCVTKEMSDKVKADLENHVETTHSESFFRCPNCPKWSYTLAGIKGHSNWCLKQILKDQCAVDLPKKEKRLGNKKYMAKTLGLMKILCNLCKLGFSMRSMKAHLATVHGIIHDSFQCEHCPRKFSLYEYLVGHMELVHEIPLEEIVLIPGPEDKMSNEMPRTGLRKWKRKAKNLNSGRQNKSDRDNEEGSEEDEEIQSEISDSGDDVSDDENDAASESTTNKKKKRVTTNKQPRRKSVRSSRGISSKYNMNQDLDPETPSEEAIPSTIEPKSRRKKVIIKPPKRKVAKAITKHVEGKAEKKYPDLEKEKRLVIYVHPLTEEELKPYIKKVNVVSLNLFVDDTLPLSASADESNT